VQVRGSNENVVSETNSLKEGAMLHVDLLLGNDREISNYTMTVTRKRPITSNRGIVASVYSVPSNGSTCHNI
jgi:hypothetical protein